MSMGVALSRFSHAWKSSAGIRRYLPTFTDGMTCRRQSSRTYSSLNPVILAASFAVSQLGAASAADGAAQTWRAVTRARSTSQTVAPRASSAIAVWSGKVATFAGSAAMASRLDVPREGE
jgi:hypothetical protein